jgi:hypothetical protein
MAETPAKPPEPKWRILAPTHFEQLRKQASDLHKAYRRCDSEAVSLFTEYHHKPPAPETIKRADAQLVLARAHDYPSWARLKRAVELYNAICADDAETVLALIRQYPKLLHERVNGVTSNWGPPLACAVQIGAAKVFAALMKLPGQDLQWALGRATLKGRSDMARALIAQGASVEPGEVMGPCESLNIGGLQFLASIGAPLTDEHGDHMAPIGMLLEGYFRDPDAKHECLKFFAQHGIDFPDTPVMAFHRGRIDLLEKHLAADRDLVHRRFSYREIYPLELGCHDDEGLGLHGAPLDGTTLLHMAADFDEIGIARWLIANGADVNAKARIDDDGFGGHTPLFNIVVSQAWRSRRQRDGAFARLLLDNGADPNARATLRKAIRFHSDESEHIYNDVTPLDFGRAFHARAWVSAKAMELIAEAVGR